jgi:hypothetical protein
LKTGVVSTSRAPSGALFHMHIFIFIFKKGAVCPSETTVSDEKVSEIVD